MKIRALVVDDNFVNRKLLISILNDRAECDVASNGVEAIEAYELSMNDNNPYDIIFLDIAMPEKDGMEVLKTIRSQEELAGIPLGKGVPIIMVTAFKEYFLKAFKDGCEDYVLKPIEAAKIYEKLDKFVTNKKK